MQKEKTVFLIKRYWFEFIIILAAVIKQLLIVGLPIFALYTAECDDRLFCNWAETIGNGQWLGTFDRFTFMKPAGFSIFLAVCKKFSVSYITMTTILYTVACILFAYTLCHIFKRRIWVVITYLIMLFNPAFFALDNLQRVYRGAFSMALTLFVVSAVFQIYFHVKDKKAGKFIIWTVFASGTLGYLWITKSDTMWLLPLIVVVLAVSGVLLLKEKEKKIKEKLLRSVFLIFPFLGIWVMTTYHGILNTRYYGSDGISYYQAAISDIFEAKEEKSEKNISLTRKKFLELCDLSPTLKKAESQILAQMEMYGKFDTHPKDGEVEDGWVEWAIISGTAVAGYYTDSATANEFYKNVYEELEVAYADGTLERQPRSLWQEYHLDTLEHGKELIGKIGEAISYMVSFQDAMPEMKYSGIDKETMKFEQITGNFAVFEKLQYDYACRGWILFTDERTQNYKMYLENNAGEKIQEVEFVESGDVAAIFPDLSAAKNCRYSINWKKDGVEQNYYLVAYQEDEMIGKVKLTLQGYENVGNTSFEGSMESSYSNEGRDENREKAQKTVGRLQVISNCYQKAGKYIFGLGVLCYIGYTINTIIQIRKKQYGEVNAWLVITGIGLSVIVLCAGIAATELEKCPAIKCMYLGSGYPLLSAFAIMSIGKGSEQLKKWGKR